jgi:hypothetical protein
MSTSQTPQLVPLMSLGIFLFCLSLIFFLIGIAISKTSPDNKSTWQGLVWTGVALFILCVFFLIGGGIQSNASTGLPNSPITVTVPQAQGFTNTKENFGNTSDTYESIGYGPLIDAIKVQNWLNGQTSGPEKGVSNWPDGSGSNIQITSDQFQSLYGFIPPSFTYFPMGQNTNNYTPTNYQDGRSNCMAACSMTNCTAVQTEVPQNCSQEALTAGASQNSCGNNATYSCTLYPWRMFR